MSQIDYLLACGVASGVLSLMAYLPYIAHTMTGKTKPQRASWFIWSVLATISFAAQIAEGATTSLWFAGVQTAATVFICLLSIKQGVGGIANKADLLALMAAGLGIALWAYTNTPAYALLISIGISLLGGAITVVKAYRMPETETLFTWMTCCCASGLAIVAVGQISWMLLAYPLYLFVLNGAIVLAILLGGRRHSAPHLKVAVT